MIAISAWPNAAYFRGPPLGPASLRTLLGEFVRCALAFSANPAKEDAVGGNLAQKIQVRIKDHEANYRMISRTETGAKSSGPGVDIREYIIVRGCGSAKKKRELYSYRLSKVSKLADLWEFFLNNLRDFDSKIVPGCELSGTGLYRVI